ncbi:unnamed protein product [Rotaria socialis]
MSSIEQLPNEIIYRIFDNVDSYSIINFCFTSKRFYSCLNNYTSFKINFESILKETFDLIINLINPLNIISLKLNDDDKTPGIMKYFIKNFQINKLNRLKSLKLIKINENDLENILKHLINNPLNSIEIEYRQYFTMLNQSTILILYQILSKETLREVHLDMRSYQNDFIQWPQTSNIKYLTLIHSNLYQFVQIIEKSNKYKSVTLKNFTMKNLNKIPLKSFHLKQLKSFKIEDSELIMEIIQWFISFMSDIVYFKLDGFTNIIENIFKNDQLENLFENKLKNLITFQFFIRFSSNETLINNSIIGSFIQQFKKSYWITNLNCFINCDFIKNCNEIHLYSLPCLNNSFKYSDKLNMISLSTLSSMNYLNQRFYYINQLELNLSDLDTKSINLKNGADSRLFPKLNSLKLTINDQCSLNCFEYLSKIIHLNNIEKIILIICSRGDYLNFMIKEFLNFLTSLSNVNSIEIFNRWHGIFSSIDIEYFCSIIPKTVKHLDIDIFDIDNIKSLIERLEHLSSFKFKFSFNKSPFIKNILQWLSNKKINSTYILDIHYLSIWISSKTFHQTNSNKRVKLTS